MGLSFGGSGGSSTTSSKSSGTSAPTYTDTQSQLQDALARAYQILVPAASSGGMSPNVAALQTKGADQINKSSNSLLDRTQKFLAARGFGSSGESGKAALGVELGRQSDLAANNSNAAGLQLNQNQSYLQQALQYAFANAGTTASSTGWGNTSGYNLGGGAAFALPGVQTQR